MASNKRNWDRIRNQKKTDTAKYRDVYEEQQLDRGSRVKVQNMTSRNILNIVICLVVFIMLWFFVSMVEMLFSGKGERELSSNPKAVWIHVNPYYVNKNDESDKLTPSEYEQLVANFRPNSVTPVDKPIEPAKPVNPATLYKPLESGGYVSKDGNNTYLSADNYAALVETYKQQSSEYESKIEQYNIDLKAYEEYKIATTNPKERYTQINEHYRNRADLNKFITVKEYEALVKEYEHDLIGGKISDDLKDVPFMPDNPAVLYKVSKTGALTVVDENGIPIRDENGEYVMNEDQPMEYASVLDGTKISYMTYNNLVATYEDDVEKYLEVYHEHRVKYHPDDIDGTAKTFDLSPTLIKFAVSGGISVILFSVLYVVLSKNLKAQNLMADTSDINQYTGDQHIALPEEIQRNYDWFPDVGAHSAVQVSSMISHMALMNKGLKNIQLAKRADKDIVDKNGDIEYYKGEILMDHDNNPITSSVSIIDEAFMEDLFDASGAPKDKEIRKRYDTTKIPYNPDGSNRDKLGKFDTVADLINKDWEFPIYEPQRPGGAYIVDTAPVNTINKRYTT